jgi:hypothetical protein
MGPLANGALCLSTPKHNGKSGTADMAGLLDIFIFDIYSSYDPYMGTPQRRRFLGCIKLITLYH